MRVSVLSKNTALCSRSGLKPEKLDPESSALHDHEATAAPANCPAGVKVKYWGERTRMRKAERTAETHLELHEVRTVETDGEINPYGNIGGSLLKTPEDD